MPTATHPGYVLPQTTDRAVDYEYIAQFLPMAFTGSVKLILADISSYILRASQAIWPVAVNPDSLLADLTKLEVSVVNPDAVCDYLARHTDLPVIVGQTTREVRQALQDVRLSLELVYDPEDTSTETLVLYLHTTEVEPSLFEGLRAWNRKVAGQMTSSEAWFIVNLDLRRQV